MKPPKAHPLRTQPVYGNTALAEQPAAGSNSERSAGSGTWMSQEGVPAWDNLIPFIAGLECRLAALDPEVLSSAAVAAEVQAVLKQLIVRETGSLELEDDLSRLLLNLYAPAAIEHFALELAERSHALLFSSEAQGSSSAETRRSLVLDAGSFLSWFLRRSNAYAQIEAEQIRSGEIEILAGVEILPDRRLHGLSGFEVRACALLSDRAGEPLWVKAFTRQGDAHVRTRIGWESWRDATDCFQARADGYARRFAVIAPLRPEQQHCVLEDLRFFVPWAALDLKPGAEYLELDLGVYDSRGGCLMQAARPVRVPSGALAKYQSQPTLLSPQALALWGLDLGTGSRITSIRPRLRRSAYSENHSVAIQCSFELAGCQGSTVSVQARVLDLSEALDSSSDRPARSGGRDASRVVDIVSSWQRCCGIELVLPVGRPGHESQQPLVVEVSVQSEDLRTLCGTQEVVGLL